MRVEIIEERCVSAGQCAAIAPEIFDQRDEDGVVVLMDPKPSEEHWDSVRQAAASCPAVAIAFEE
ncbi:ferredoxin [Rhodococcus sp. SMB37]|uniref:ferredoxin n=1 Tax=Rhodococcus sp. SMB37 TaxID=2512213 RepID=UPI0006D025AE|nr:ferredoxin [Rhodococcus sp. SMB37]TCN50818.1 ferredoxin [Rhodococcus sp. SMB37]